MIFVVNIFLIEQRYTFKKEEKLKSRKSIDLLFKQGKSFSHSPFRVLYTFIDSSQPQLQTGFAVSGKNFKKAVDRNRIKRLMREAYRLQKHVLTEKVKKTNKCLNVFFIYTGKEIPGYKVIADKMQGALKKLNTIADEVSAANT